MFFRLHNIFVKPDFHRTRIHEDIEYRNKLDSEADMRIRQSSVEPDFKILVNGNKKIYFTSYGLKISISGFRGSGNIV